MDITPTVVSPYPLTVEEAGGMANEISKEFQEEVILKYKQKES